MWKLVLIVGLKKSVIAKTIPKNIYMYRLKQTSVLFFAITKLKMPARPLRRGFELYIVCFTDKKSSP